MDTEGKQAIERATRQVSEETKAKLSESMKRHWQQKRATEAAINMTAKAATSPATIMRLYAAAEQLVNDDVDMETRLREAIVGTATLDTVCYGLAHATNEGTNLQARLAQVLRDFITEEMP